MVITFFLTIFTLFNGIHGQICNKLHMGTTLRQNSESNDIIRDGIPTSSWIPESQSSAVVSASKNLDFFYLPNIDFDLDQSNIQLSYDNTEHVVSHATLKKEQRGWYTIEVSYNCDLYGGVLINFKLGIDVPDCGSTTVGWRKLCGNPFTEREGLTMEMAFNDINQVVVKNGKALTPQYYHSEIDNYAHLIPASTNAVRLDIFINLDDLSNDTNSTNAHAFNSIEQNPDKKYNLDTYISKIRADSDRSVADIQLYGGMANQGVSLVTTTKSTLNMIFNCTRSEGTATVELDIILPLYKDITLFFVKSCEATTKQSIFTSLKFWLVLLAFGGFAYATFANLKFKGKKGLAALPFYDIISGLFHNTKKGVMKPNKSPLQGRELGEEGVTLNEDATQTKVAYGTLCIKL